ncbi:MAG: DUF5696 domain-containing protein, partial [Chloroflexus sp.]|nr:DUF5696 domain-containing protein [Chloroflexus sp.]
MQPQTNAFDIVQHYRFLTGADADYVGLARAYQTFGVEKGFLRPMTVTSGDMPLRLEFLGAEREKLLFWYRAIPMTTVEQMRAILEALPVRRVEVVYYGWQPGGAAAQTPLRPQLERTLGDLKALEALAETLTLRGGTLSLYFDPQVGVVDEGGYTRSEVAMAITRATLGGYHRGVRKVYLTVESVQRRLKTLSAAAREHGLEVAVDGVSFRLY